MSTYFGDWRKSVSNPLWPESVANHSATTLPVTVADVFEKKIKEIINLQGYLDAEEAVIQECIQAVKDDLGSFDFVPSVYHWDKLKVYCDTFSRLIDTHASPSLNLDAAKSIGAHFQSSCIKQIAEQWVASAAQHFYLILSLSTQAEKIEAAQLWRQQFFVVHKRISQFFKENPVDFNLATQLEIAFCAHWHMANTLKMGTLSRWQKNDTTTFMAIEAQIKAKARRNPAFLSCQEQDYLEYKDNTNSTQDWPLFNTQAKCLQQCLEVNDLVVNSFTELEINALEYYRQKGQ